MILYESLPELTEREARRHWLTADDVLDIAGLWVGADPVAIRKFYAGLTDRGFIPYRASGTARTSPRLYALGACVMTRTIWSLSRMGLSFAAAADVATVGADLLLEAIRTFPTLGDLTAAQPWKLALFGETGIELVPAAEITADRILAHRYLGCGVADLGELVDRCIRNYAEHWAEARARDGGRPAKRAPGGARSR